MDKIMTVKLIKLINILDTIIVPKRSSGNGL